MILPIVRASFVALRRDRGALLLFFAMPLVFFSVFAYIFGSRNTTPTIDVVVADEDRSRASTELVTALRADASIAVKRVPSRSGTDQLTAQEAEQAVKSGSVLVALVIHRGFGDRLLPGDQKPAGEAKGSSAPLIQLLEDSSDKVAAQIVNGALQKATMKALPAVLTAQGSKYVDQLDSTVQLTPEQRTRLQGIFQKWQQGRSGGDSASSGSDDVQGLVPVQETVVVGTNKANSMVTFYAAAIGVMFLLLTASSSAGSLLEESESGTLDRVLTSRVTMTSLLLGKLTYVTLLSFVQLLTMFLWAWAVFHVEFWPHTLGFIVMGACTALAAGSFGILLASLCRTRAQLGAVSTLVGTTMSAIGGSMFPRVLMSAGMQKLGLFTINAWAIDGFTKVFWRDEPISHLWPQVLVLMCISVALFAVARRATRRYEIA